MKPLTHFKKTKILRNIFLSLGAIFALVTSRSRTEPLRLSSTVRSDAHAILEFTPSGTQSTLRFGVVVPSRVGL